MPFVIYRKPNTDTVTGFFQDSDTLYATENYLTPGFIFAPFDTNHPTYIFPIESCEVIKEEVEISNRANFESPEFLSSNESMSKASYVELVRKAKEYIHISDLKKVVLSRVEKVSVAGVSPLQSFIKMLATYSNAMVYLWYHPKEGMWLGATPETLITTHKDRIYTTALAGTQLYEGKMDVYWGLKEKKEHQYVVDFITDQLRNTNISTDDMKVSNTYTTRAGDLLHLRTDISCGILDSNIKNTIEALHPTPAVCGLPKQPAQNFILKNEGYNREFYTGFLGEIHMNDSLELFVNLRCAKLFEESIQIYVGGGITDESIPDDEWKETVFKTQTIKNIISKSHLN